MSEVESDGPQDTRPTMDNLSAINDLISGGQAGEEPKKPAPKTVEKDAPPAAAEQARQEADQLLTGDIDSDTAPDETMPSSLAKLAEQAGISEKELYQHTIPFGHGEDGNITIGDLKDRYNKQVDVEQLREQLDDRTATHERETLQQRQEMQELMQLLPELPQGLAEKAAQMHSATLNHERAELLRVKPEWRDAKTWNSAQDDMAAAAAEFGLSRAEFNVVIDHRWIAFMSNYVRMDKRIKAAAARMKSVRTGSDAASPKPTVKTGDTTRAAVKETSQPKGTAAKVAAVADILKGAQQ